MIFDFDTVEPPWERERPGICNHILANLLPGQLKQSEEGLRLPDESLVAKNLKIQLAPGALDGACGFEKSEKESNEEQRELRFQALETFLYSPDAETLSHFYGYLISIRTTLYIDDFLKKIASASLLKNHTLYSLAKWILKNSPDREAVKASIAMLGVCTNSDDRQLFLDIGTHPEFTLFAAIAIKNSNQDAEEHFWKLAKSVDGWGRIQLIRKLASTKNNDIQKWMLRDGYKNDIAIEETAFVCATTGNLLEEISKSTLDSGVLKASAEIITALFQSPRGSNIYNYQDGPLATLLLVKHLSQSNVSLKELVYLCQIRTFLNELKDEFPWKKAWDEVKKEIQSISEPIINRPGWQNLIDETFDNSPDPKSFIAECAAQQLGMDIWDKYFERTKNGGSDWFWLLPTDNQERLISTVTLAEKRMPLEEYALKIVIQNVIDHPGLGRGLVLAGLQNESVRCRNISIMTLKAWGKEYWDSEIIEYMKNIPE